MAVRLHPGQRELIHAVSFAFGPPLLIAAIAGAIGQAIVGFSRGGCLAAIAVGFIGAYLGWSEPDVARFAERLTGCSWEDCQATELGQLVGTYAEIATRVRARLSNVEA